MRLKIDRASDAHDPLNQLTYISVRERIGDREYENFTAVSHDVMRKSETMTMIMEEVARRMAWSFAEIIEKNILEEIFKASDPERFAAGQLLPKDILLELEPMEEKRILENLGVTV